MARLKRHMKIANSVTLFALLALTAFVSHVLTLWMLPPATVRWSYIPDHISFQSFSLRGQAKTPIPKVSALGQLLAGASAMPKKAFHSIGHDSLAREKSLNTTIEPKSYSESQSMNASFSDHFSKGHVNPKVQPRNYSETNEASTTIQQRAKGKSAQMVSPSQRMSMQMPTRPKKKQSISLWGKPKDKNLKLVAPATLNNSSYVHGYSLNVTNAEQNAVKNQTLPINITKMSPLGESKWVGNDWYPPPGGKLFDLHELKTMFSRSNILWIGDSQFKYTYSTLMRVLNSKAPTLKSVFLKRLSIKPCATDASISACSAYHDVTLDFATINCFMEMRQFIANHDFSKYNLVIIDFGEEEMLDKCPYVLDEKVNMFVDIATRMKELPTNVTWTTLAWREPAVVAINRKIIELCKKGDCSSSSNNVSIFDYAAGMQHGSDLIKVTIKKKKVLYSEYARLAYIQMLANHLAQRFPDVQLPGQSAK